MKYSIITTDYDNRPMKKNVLQIIYERWSKNSKEKTIDKTQINPGHLMQQLKKYYINKYKLFMQDGPRGGTINGKKIQDMT